jgi:hypothetical protein
MPEPLFGESDRRQYQPSPPNRQLQECTGSAGPTADDRASGYGAPVAGLRIRTPPSERALVKSNMFSMDPAIVSNEAPG